MEEEKKEEEEEEKIFTYAQQKSEESNMVFVLLCAQRCSSYCAWLPGVAGVETPAAGASGRQPWGGRIHRGLGSAERDSLDPSHHLTIPVERRQCT